MPIIKVLNNIYRLYINSITVYYLCTGIYLISTYLCIIFDSLWLIFTHISVFGGFRIRMLFNVYQRTYMKISILFGTELNVTPALVVTLTSKHVYIVRVPSL